MYFVIQNLAKYFTMLTYVTFNSVTVQIRPIFIYSPLFAGYNELGYTRIWGEKLAEIGHEIVYFTQGWNYPIVR